MRQILALLDTCVWGGVPNYDTRWDYPAAVSTWNIVIDGMRGQATDCGEVVDVKGKAG